MVFVDPLSIGLNSYLRGQRHSFTVDTEISSSLSLTFVAPRGSILWFLIYIGDFQKTVLSTTKLIILLMTLMLYFQNQILGN